MDLLKDLTIVIPTFNRPRHLERLLNFLKLLDVESNILILDSGSTEEAARLVNSLRKGRDILYRRFPSDTFLSLKIAEGLKDVDTEFAVLCADDDFLLPSGLCRAVDFLEQNSDYVMAQGIFALHYPDVSRGRVSFSPVYPAQRAIEGGVRHRLSMFMRGHSGAPLFYAVMRSEILKSAWAESARCVSDWGLVETMPGAFALLFGKMKYLPYLYASREPNTYQWYDEAYLKKIYSSERCEIACKALIECWSKVDAKDESGKAEFLTALFDAHRQKQFRKFSTATRSIYDKLRWRMRLEWQRFIITMFAGQDWKELKRSLLSCVADPLEINVNRKTYRREE